MRFQNVIGLTLLLSGLSCYSSRRTEIESSFKSEREAFNVQCKDSMNGPSAKWCNERYSHIELARDQEVKQDAELVASGNKAAVIATVVVLSVMVVAGTTIAIHCLDGGAGLCRK